MIKKLLLILMLTGCATTTIPIHPDTLITCVNKYDQETFSFYYKDKKETYLEWADIKTYQITTIDGKKIQINQFEQENFNCKGN